MTFSRANALVCYNHVPLLTNIYIPLFSEDGVFWKQNAPTLVRDKYLSSKYFLHVENLTIKTRKVVATSMLSHQDLYIPKLFVELIAKGCYTIP